METKKLLTLSMIAVAAFATAQINAFNIVGEAVDTAGRVATDAGVGAANIGAAAVGSPYRYGVARPVVVYGQPYGTQVQPGGVLEEETMYAQPVQSVGTSKILPVGTQEEIEAGVTEDYPMGY